MKRTSREEDWLLRTTGRRVLVHRFCSPPMPISGFLEKPSALHDDLNSYRSETDWSARIVRWSENHPTVPEPIPEE